MRYGKGKPMDQQAHALLKSHLDLTSRHQAKQQQGIHGSRSTGRIHSLRTIDKYASALTQAGTWAQREHDLRHLRDLTAAQAQAYLTERAAHGLSQKQLDADRVALGFLVGPGLERVHATVTPDRSTRAYTPAQIQLIAAAQTGRNTLATQIAYAAGLRAHELFTLRRAEEAHASTHRRWHPDRFSGRSGERYVVTGKGGLMREVLIPAELATRLEAQRLDAPRDIADRKIHYQQHYDLAGGNAWSRSTTDAAQRALGWSTGAHGLRHAYAQERMKELQGQGKSYDTAREIVSQELGHFRGDVVETYLR